MLVVINFGSQVAHLIARRIRQLGVYSEILPHDVSPEAIQKLRPAGIILSGGPASVYEEGAPHVDERIFELSIPVLGICYGLQLMGQKYGKVENKQVKEFGKAALQVKQTTGIFKGLKKEEQVWMSHGDAVTALKGFEVIGSTPSCAVAAVADEKRKLYGVQFHPEVAHTLPGMKILENFAFGICKAEKDFNISDMRKTLVKEIRDEVKEKEVLMAISGGVDSTVAATLIQEAIGDKLHCVFIDHGFIREGEKAEVDAAYRKLFKNYYSVDASELFLKQLEGVSDPEQKRKIIGHLFIEVFEKKAKELEKEHPDIAFLGQGTIYPDRVESAQTSKTASKIKSHHNVTLPEKMKLKVIEPLKDFYKDDVRALGKQIGVPAAILSRHPFPGPGLAIRVLGEITREKLGFLKKADAIFIEELKRSGEYDKVWQALAALFPVKTVGVMGDARTYQYVVSLRAVTSIDAMTADWAKLPYELLERVSTRIVNEVKGINRVVYDLTQKPPGTIEYE
ncbi:MAG: glutamine-hydrolyzing GMP synthase [Nanoarchaeota archaeon]|nr:glutamine-hydrolyzing GMP synthase [Nanoarchaeota archaeon]